MHFPLFLTLTWLCLCMCMNLMKYKVGNLEFQREQLFGMKSGINLRMKVAITVSLFLQNYFHVLHELTCFINFFVYF